ncbi:hypothetical protein [Enemella evansiae]|uniref:hypothetical protein n=1 Tax=Enemella evansiae TaxID=2016499 RepID=UPI000B979A78|nr:hypothetical protein [Enemella evansiae]OYO01893.1 hypothetical protein CGZ97_15880 [Enemella evansiae]
MSDPSQNREVSVHVLRPAPPIRAFGLASVFTVLGAVLLVTAYAQGWSTVLKVLFGIVLVLGLALLGAAIATVVRMRVRAELTPTGYSFRTPAGVRHGTWADTAKVSTSESGHRLSFVDNDDRVQHVISPVGGESPEMSALTAEIVERLESSRD